MTSLSSLYCITVDDSMPSGQGPDGSDFSKLTIVDTLPHLLIQQIEQ